jgi:putative DNA primase/helicase
MNHVEEALPTPAIAGWLMNGHAEADPLAAYSAMLNMLDPDCSYNEWLAAGCAAKAAGLPFENFRAWSAGSPKYKPNECAAKWNSLTAEGLITVGTLVHLAKKAGYTGPVPATATPSNTGVAPEVSTAPTPEQVAASQALEALFNSYPKAPAEHPYIVKKSGWAEGLRVVPMGDKTFGGWLAVPVRELDGTFRTIQYISCTGEKRSAEGGKFWDGMFTFGDIDPTGKAYVVEGLGHAWTCRNVAYGTPAVVTLGAGRVRTVALALRKKFPHLNILIISDRGQEARAEAVALEVGGGWVAMPADAPSGADINDFAAQPGSKTADVRELLNEVQWPTLAQPISAQPAPGAFVFHDGDVYATDFLGEPELVEDLLPACGVAMVYGESGSGKTFWALDLAFHVQNGMQWRDKDVAQGNVYYVAAEAGRSVKKRLQGVKVLHPDWKAPYMADMAPNLSKPESITAIRTAIGDNKAALVVIDTMSASFEGDDSSQQDVAVMMRNLKSLAEGLGCLVLLIHHTRKDGTSWRGSGVLKNDTDAVIEITTEGEGEHRIHVARLAKSRDGEQGARYAFRLIKSEPLALKPNGKAIDTCTVEQAHGELPNAPKVLPASLQAVLAIYTELSLETMGSVTLAALANAVKLKGMPFKKFNFSRDYARHFKKEMPDDDTVIYL